MLKPGTVSVTRSSELQDATGQTEGMIRKGAIINKSSKLCASGASPVFPQNSGRARVFLPLLVD